MIYKINLTIKDFKTNKKEKFTEQLLKDTIEAIQFRINDRNQPIVHEFEFIIARNQNNKERILMRKNKK